MKRAVTKQLVQTVVIIGFAISALGFTLSFVVAQEKPASFNGVWQRNDEESDNPQEKMKEAMQGMRPPRGGREGRGGMGGMPPPPPEGESRGGRAGGPGGPGPLSPMSEEIETVLRDNEFHVIPSDAGRVQIYYLDGKEHKRETPNGMQLETTSERKGNRIIVVQKMRRGKFNTTYELAPDGTRMIVTTEFEGGRMKEPLIIRTVYDLIPDDVSL